MFEKGYKQSEIHKQRISQALKGRTSNWKGVKRGPMSEQQRIKVSLSKKGKSLNMTIEQKKVRAKKVLESRRKNGKPWFSEETNKKRSLSMKGIERSSNSIWKRK